MHVTIYRHILNSEREIEQLRQMWYCTSNKLKVVQCGQVQPNWVIHTKLLTRPPIMIEIEIACTGTRLINMTLHVYSIYIDFTHINDSNYVADNEEMKLIFSLENVFLNSFQTCGWLSVALM